MIAAPFVAGTVRAPIPFGNTRSSTSVASPTFSSNGFGHEPAFLASAL